MTLSVNDLQDLQKKIADILIHFDCWNSDYFNEIGKEYKICAVDFINSL